MILTTGQKECYGEAGEKIPCEGSGQDGERHGGHASSARRFEATGNTVIDHWTGLEWVRDAATEQFPLSWDEAFEAVVRLNADGAFGRRDWRLPTRRDLFGLVSHTETDPALDAGHPFENVFSGYYWTLDTCARSKDQAWYVHLGGARVYCGMKHGSYLVWPVRDASRSKAPEKIEPRFVQKSDGILDRATNLVWSRKADLDGGKTSWIEALRSVARIEGENGETRSPWRLPNVRELESLVSLESHSPAFSPNHMFENVRSFYWTSTTSVYEPSYAWAVYMRDGAVGVGYKAGREFYVWAVRQGSREP